jgi:phosphate-selective porin OprO/OprP
MGAVLCCTLSVATAPARAQVSYVPAADQQMVTISQSNFDEIMGRLTSLESAMLADEGDKPNGGWEEVDTISKPSVKVSGRVHLDYWGFPEESPLANFLDGTDPAAGPDDFLGFRRLRFGVKGNVYETMIYKIEMEFASPENLAFKDAYLGWDDLPYLQTVLLGQQKRPYGLDHLNSSRYNVFLERPYVIEAFNQDARRIGACSYGTTEDERWNWRYGWFEMDDLAKDGGQYTDNYQSELAGRLANTIWYDEASEGRGYAHWAVSGTAAFPGDGPDARFTTRPEARTEGKWFDTGQIAGCQTYQLLGLEGVLNLGSLAIVGEYQTVRAQRSNASDLTFGGGYIYAAWFLTGESQPWELYSGTLGRVKPLENAFWVRRCDGGCGRGLGAWQVAARYSHGDFSDQDIFGGVGDSFTFGLNWWWNPYARMQFNYIYGSIDERVEAGAPATAGDYNIFGTRFMCDF